jgi:hypothetical protein
MSLKKNGGPYTKKQQEVRRKKVNEITLNKITYCPEIKSHTNPIISLIMCCISQKVVNFVGKLRMTLIEPYFDTCS